MIDEAMKAETEKLKNTGTLHSTTLVTTRTGLLTRTMLCTTAPIRLISKSPVLVIKQSTKKKITGSQMSRISKQIETINSFIIYLDKLYWKNEQKEILQKAPKYVQEYYEASAESD